MVVVLIFLCFLDSNSINGVTITTAEFGTSTFCSPADFQGTPYHNQNRGVFLASGTAKIDFCSDNNDAVSSSYWFMENKCLLLTTALSFM